MCSSVKVGKHQLVLQLVFMQDFFLYMQDCASSGCIMPSIAGSLLCVMQHLPKFAATVPHILTVFLAHNSLARLQWIVFLSLCSPFSHRTEKKKTIKVGPKGQCDTNNSKAHHIQSRSRSGWKGDAMISVQAGWTPT